MKRKPGKENNLVREEGRGKKGGIQRGRENSARSEGRGGGLKAPLRAGREGWPKRQRSQVKEGYVNKLPSPCDRDASAFSYISCMLLSFPSRVIDSCMVSSAFTPTIQTSEKKIIFTLATH